MTFITSSQAHPLCGWGWNDGCDSQKRLVAISVGWFLWQGSTWSIHVLVLGIFMLWLCINYKAPRATSRVQDCPLTTRSPWSQGDPQQQESAGVYRLELLCQSCSTKGFPHTGGILCLLGKHTLRLLCTARASSWTLNRTRDLSCKVDFMSRSNNLS